MSDQSLLYALENFRTNMEQFQSNITDLRHQMRSMNAQVKAFERKNTEILQGVDMLRDKSRSLEATMARAAQISS